MQLDFPLTRFLMELNDASTSRIRAMPIDKTAKHYGIKPAYVEGYRNMALALKK